MSVDRASRLYRVVVCAPGETVSTGLDVSEIVVGFDGGWPPIDQSGISSFTGNLTLQGFPLASLGINTNPRRDRIRWARGNRVIFWLVDSTGNLTRFLTTHILKDPLPPSPGTQPNLSLSLGDKLTFLSFRQPPGDKSGVPIGGSNTRKNVIDNLLIASGAGMSFGGISGDINVPLQKLTNQSYIQQAGQIAFAGNRFLWVDPMGTVRLSPIDLDGAADVSLTIGADEISYEPIEGQETPAELVKCTGTKYTAVATPDATETEKEAWGLAAVVDANAGGKTILSRETIRESWAGNVRTVETDRLEARGLVFPDVTSNRLGLTPSLQQVERWIYEGGREGKLLRVEKSATKPFAVALREYFATLDPAEQAIARSNMIPAERSEADYDYRKEVTSEIRSTTSEPMGAILPNEDWTAGNPTALTPTVAENQSWEKLYRNAYLYTQETYGAAAREFPDAIAALPPETPISGKLGLLLTNKEAKTSNSGQTTPPAAERRKPKVTIEETPIAGVAEFKPFAGSEFQPRERTYDVPYADEVELEAAAKLLGRLLFGRRMGQSIAFALSDWWLTTRPPIARAAVTEPDGNVEKYLLNSIAIAFDDRNCYLAADGIWLGSIEGGAVKPPMLSVAASTGGIGFGGNSIAFPYPLLNPFEPTVGGIGFGGGTANLMPLDPSVGGIGFGGDSSRDRPFHSGEGGIGFGGETILPLYSEGGIGFGGDSSIPFNPNRASLRRMLGASTNVVNTANRVTQWGDGGNLTTFVTGSAGSNPLLVANSLNTRPVVRFAGTEVLSGGFLGDLISTPVQGGYSGATYTAFVVLKPNAVTLSDATSYNNHPVLSDEFAFWGLYLRRPPGNPSGTPEAVMYHWEGAEAQLSSPLPSATAAVLISFWSPATQVGQPGYAIAMNLQVNQTPVVSRSSGSPSSMSGTFRIGGGAGLNADIAEVWIFNEVLSASDRASVQADLNARYALF